MLQRLTPDHWVESVCRQSRIGELAKAGRDLALTKVLVWQQDLGIEDGLCHERGRETCSHVSIFCFADNDNEATLTMFRLEKCHARTSSCDNDAETSSMAKTLMPGKRFHVARCHS